MIISRPYALLQTSAGRAPSKFLSRRRRFHLPPFLPKAECAAPDHKDPKASGHTCCVPSTAKPSSVTSPSDMPVASTNLKRDPGDTEDSLCNRVQLPAVNFLLVLCECRTTNLCEHSAILNRLVHRLFHRSTHQWRISL